MLLIGLAGALVAMAVLGIFHGTFTRIFADRSNLYGLYGLYLPPPVLSEVVFILLRAYSRSLGRSTRTARLHPGVRPAHRADVVDRGAAHGWNAVLTFIAWRGGLRGHGAVARAGHPLGR